MKYNRKANYFMAKTKAQKGDQLTSLGQIAKTAKSVVFVQFDKLTVNDETELRRALRNESNSYGVVKKTLLRKAFTEAGIEGEMPNLEGMVAIAYGDDLLSPAREVFNFHKTHKDNVSIVGGVYEGKFMSREEMMAVATIPPIEVLYGQFVNVINSPIQGFVMALNAIADLPAQAGKKTA